MSKWIQKSFVATSSAGTDATISFSAATAGSFLVAVASSNTVLSTPSGWALAQTAVGDQALYVWTKTASSGEDELITTRSVADVGIATVVYELPAGSSVIDSDPSVNFNLSGVAVDGISGMTSDPKLLMHYATYAPSNNTVTADIYFDDATVQDTWEKVVAGSDSNYLLSGYLEDSTLTDWAPRVLVGTVSGGTLGTYSQRITIAINVPLQLPTPTPTVTAQQNPSTIGGTNGSITVTWPVVAGAVTYSAGIANGLNQTSGFTVTDSDVTSPYTFTNLAAGQYTVAIRAEP